jgi:ParB family transcriptional regulator, chromosome partitioning protein
MESALEIVPLHRRRFEEIPVAQVKVINSHYRDKEQSDGIVPSIDHAALLKPIRVNDKFLEQTGMYELICGEGRLLAHQKLGRKRIMAEIITCTRKEAYLQSLIKSVPRIKPDAMKLAREIKRLHEEGWDYKEIARIASKSEWYIRRCIRLVEQEKSV